MKLEGDVEFIVPESVQALDEDFREDWWECALDSVLDSYEALIKRGVPKEDARYLLPNATPTKLIWTANFRQWLHIIEQRSDPAAQWEIRQVVEQIRIVLAGYAPAVFGE